MRMIGIIEEQHGERARLFMQWKQMGWPVLVDSLNLLEVPYVPITLAIDEHGVVRTIYPPMGGAGEIEEQFLNRTYEKPDGLVLSRTTPPDLKKLKAATRKGTGEGWRAYADALVLWGGPNRLGEAITAYQQALRLEPGHGRTHFRLGVAYRKRYDSPKRQAGDFQKAVEHWGSALDADPNNYIWRRRIQQYGPRLDKPYPFYSWVHVAREEIRARGQVPSGLAVEPGGAELAKPATGFEGAKSTKVEPDPEGRISRDKRRFIDIETTVVPSTIGPGLQDEFTW